MNVRNAVNRMLEVWDSLSDVQCLNESNLYVGLLYHTLSVCTTVKDVQRFVWAADIFALWSHDNRFEEAYGVLIDIAEHDGTFVRPDMSV